MSLVPKNFAIATLIYQFLLLYIPEDEVEPLENVWIIGDKLNTSQLQQPQSIGTSHLD